MAGSAGACSSSSQLEIPSTQSSVKSKGANQSGGTSYIAGVVGAVDPAAAELIAAEHREQATCIRLIASENYASRAVSLAVASVFGNRYAEGYPHQWKNGELIATNGRYYQGQSATNGLESLAIDRCLALFAGDRRAQYHANVQPLSGAPANLAVYGALLKPGDTLLGMSLDYGGHLTHGHRASVTSSYYRAVQYPLGESGLLDYDLIRKMAIETRPKLIVCGASSYPRTIDFAAFGSIAREVGALLLADIAHISGLVVAGVHPHPLPYADVVTTTTHKILRGPRGGIIVCRKELGAAVDKAVFPGLQGGPHMNNVAGIAVALCEAATPSYRDYAAQVVRNAKALASALIDRGFVLLTGGTDNHLLVIDLRRGRGSEAGILGAEFAARCEAGGIILNKNAVPGDAKPWLPSGVRIGTPAVTTLGMAEAEMVQLADLLARLASKNCTEATIAAVKGEVRELMARFPTPDC